MPRRPDNVVGTPPVLGHRFVVHRHRARRLHYDLRLEIGGTLVSWAVPKGPTLDADARRLAVRVDDHGLDYFEFEGVIGHGGVRASDVIVWDWGTWSLTRGADARAALDAGDLRVRLVGEKLSGRFALVRTDRRNTGVDRQQWLLLHKHDDAAVAGWDPEALPVR